MSEWMYDVAQICQNGHVVNSATQSHPASSAAYCSRCGEETLTACPSCKARIRGAYLGPGTFLYDGPPAHCDQCGVPFPWTKRAIQAAIELSLEESHIEGEEAKEFIKAVGDIVKDGPATPLAASRFKKVMAKVGPQAATLVQGILVAVVSETAKKLIWPDVPPSRR